MTTQKITFSFGKNWLDYVQSVSDKDIAAAENDISDWLGDVSGKRVLDVGSGSGIHSLAFHRLGAKSIHSFDYDPLSVEASRVLHRRFESPSSWTIEQGSALDREYLTSLGTFDIVYSWGVLHATGAMWEAIENCFRLVASGGIFWLAVYGKTPRFPQELALKERYNAASDLGKRMMIWHWIGREMLRCARCGQNPLKWNRRVGRGMYVYHDIVDWLGGLPYEAATTDEVVRFARERRFNVERLKTGQAIIDFKLSSP